jgi:hypothetical protein
MMWTAALKELVTLVDMILQPHNTNKQTKQKNVGVAAPRQPVLLSKIETTKHRDQNPFPNTSDQENKILNPWNHVLRITCAQAWLAVSQQHSC